MEEELRNVNNYVGNADAAIVSHSDINPSHDDSSSQQSDFSLEKCPYDEVENEASGNIFDNDHYKEKDFNERSGKYQIPSKDVLYNPDLDEEDEAWVYKYKRGGDINLLKDQLSHTTKNKWSSCTQEGNVKASRYGEDQALVLPKKSKPRTSDAVLSCPCCFEIVCMDCQRHERYANQFRAMFVMNIGVSWDKTICPEYLGGRNVDVERQRNRHISGEDNVKLNISPVSGGSGSSTHSSSIHNANEEIDNANEEIYYSVYCNKCHTVVAGLNMQDEVYHFFGCLASG